MAAAPLGHMTVTLKTHGRTQQVVWEHEGVSMEPNDH